MVWNQKTEIEPEDKAGYNSAGRITEILSMLRSTFIASMIANSFPPSLECCRGVVDIIAGKVDSKEIGKLNKLIYVIEESFSMSEQFYNDNGMRKPNYPRVRIIVKRNLEFLWRKIEEVQDKYGYGMFSEDESGL